MIYGTPERKKRPDFLKFEERRLALEGGLKIEDEKEEQRRVPPIHYHLPSQDEASWRMKVEGEVKELSVLLRASHEENQRLRRELQCALEARSATSRFSTPQAILDEAVEARAKAKEDAEKKVRRKEDAEKKERSEEVPNGPAEDHEKETPDEGSEVTSDSGPKTAEERTMHMVLKLMTGMQDLQRQILSARSEDKSDEIEYVRYSQEIPRLVEWSPETAPIDYNDWLVQIHPFMSDLTSTSDDWWSATLAEARSWYEVHMKLSPIQRLQHHPQASEKLKLKKWGHLERRASSMLLAALPDALKEEVISSKSVTALGILAKSMISYQPGGIGERGAILSALEGPAEAVSVPAAVVGIRKWIRWRRRALEIGASVPDATVLVRGLGKLLKRVLTQHPDLHFRLSLMRSELQIDTVPTPETVSQYSEHVLAELEQLGQHSKKKENIDPVKLKKVEEIGGQERKKKEEEKKEGKCKFFLTEGGCRRGRSCKWSHEQRDGEKRCFNCGSNKHFATACPYKTSSSDSPQKVPKAAKMEEAEETSKGGKKELEENAKGSSEDDEKDVGLMSELLDEANKMLKSMSKKAGPSSKMQSLQSRLSDLKKEAAGLKVLRLTRMAGVDSASMVGLLDSGATHPLRSLRLGDEPKEMEKVWVALATGEKAPLLMTKTGIMVTTDESVEPILPLGWLLGKGGCEMSWGGGQLKLKHPKRGELPVTVTSGCPQVPRQLALDLIDEFDYVEAKALKIQPMVEDGDKEKAWLEELVSSHPVFNSLPSWIKDELVLKPGYQKDLPLNRHARKRMKGEMVCHLFAGKKEGFTFKKAMEEVDKGAHVLEVDWCRNPDQDMLGPSVMYRALLRVALDGDLAILLAGPNCRTRSVLRFHPQEGAPGPTRSFDEPWGMEGISESELEKTRQDDVLLWRTLFLAEVARHGRAVHPLRSPFRFLLEQPKEPENVPQCVSLWRTKEWKALKEMNHWEEQSFNQGDFEEGAVPVKPTTIAGSLQIEVPEKKNKEARGRKGDEPIESSKDLARWVPGLMRSVARACAKALPGVTGQIKAMSWAQHVEMGHVPMRRDCRICQEASAKARPHRQVKHPLAATLALDTAGPYKLGADVDQEARYMLVGTFTWLRPRGSTALEEEEEPAVEEDVEGEEWQFEEEKDLEQKLQDMEADARLAEEAAVEAGRSVEALMQALEDTEDAQEAEGREVVGSPIADALDELESLEEVEKKERGEIPVEEREEPEVVVFRLAAPMVSKSASLVLEVVNSWFIQLRVLGYELRRIHTDRGGEFFGQGLIKWAAARGIEKTTTARDSKSNGRVERAIQEMKSRMRRVLLAAGMGPSYWPLACRYVHEMERRRMADRLEKSLPPFGQQLLVKKRYWKTEEMEPTHEEVRYIAPVPEAHGHLVMRSDDSLVVVPYYIGKTSLPPESEETWIALVNVMKEEEDAYQVRRRIRGKTAMKLLKRIEEDEEEERRLFQVSLEKVIEEESFRLLEDDPEVGDFVYEELKRLKKAIPEEQEDVLRTKIVSQKQLMEEHELWREAIQKELDQLLKDREALRKVTKQQVEDLQRRSGKGIDLVPSKLVVTLKPGPRRKVRLVACGNYIDKSPDESVYAAGADTVAVRYVLKRAAEECWCAAVLDVHVAFLHAPLLKEESQKPVVLKPPQALIRLGYYDESDYFLVDKALYGLRQSPRCWGVYRDSRLLQMKSKEGIHFLPSAAEPNLWQIRSEHALVGFLLVYVDDMLACAAPEVLPVVIGMLREEWQTSEPEHIAEDPVKFLGMELRQKDGVFYAMQESYVEDKALDGVAPKKVDVPCGKECLVPPTEENITIESTQAAQKVIGELLWLSTRSRPDICFIVSKLSQAISTAPSWVATRGEAVWRYVKRTAKEGLKFGKDRGEGWALEEKAGLVAYSDSSYAPHGAASQGAVFIFWNGALMSWRSARQPFPTMSTCESELVEAMEAVTLADAFEALVMEHEEEYTKTLLCDNMATVSLMGEGSAGWRTRHLRLRAQNLRWRVSTLEWRVKFCPGSLMVADAGTKPLPKQRMQELKEKMGMCTFVKVEEAEIVEIAEAETSEALEDEIEVRGGAEAEAELKEVKRKILSMLVLMASAQSLKGQDGNAGELWTVVAVYTILVVIATLWCSQWIASMVPARNEPESAVHERNESREESPLTTEELYNLASKVKREAETSLEAAVSEGHGKKDSKNEGRSKAALRSRPAGPVERAPRSCSPDDNDPCHQGCEPDNSNRRTSWDPFEDLDPRDDVRDPEARGLLSRRLHGSSSASGVCMVSSGGEAADGSAQAQQERPKMFGPPPEGLRHPLAEMQNEDVASASGGQTSDGFTLGPRAQRVITSDAVVEPVRIFTTRCGEKYHTYRTCPHLRNASRIEESMACMQCVPYTNRWRPNGAALYTTGMGKPFHLQRDHQDYGAGEVRRLKPCHGCGLWSLALDADGRAVDP